MLARTSGSLALIAVVALAARAAGQMSPTTDVRMLALRSLQAGRTVRVAGQNIGTLTGSFVEVHDGAFWLQDRPSNRSVPVAGIDSMWVSRSHATTGALVGGLIGSVVGLVAISGKSCTLGDSGCIGGAYLESAGITLGGLLVGALIGSGTKSWQLRFP